MAWSARRVLWPLLGVAVLVAVTLVRDPIIGADRAPVELGASIAATALAGLAAILLYRLTADPRLVFVAVGSAGLSINLVLFDLVWQRGLGSLRAFHEERLAAPGDAILVAWLLFGICALFAAPWWERRGRPPLDPVTIVATTLGALAVVDLVLFLVPPTAGERILGPVLVAPGWLDTTLAWIAAGLLVVASLRLMLEEAGGSSSGWLSAAAAAAVGGPASWLLLRSDQVTAYRASQALYLAIPAVVGTSVMIASLMSARSTMSHMRRRSDRADQIVEGRAEIASMISHEVRGPVTTIRGIAATTLAHYDRLTDDERREFLVLIEQESRRMLGAVDQTALALKIDAGTLGFQIAPVELEQVVRAGVEAAAVDPDDHPVHVVAQHGVEIDADAARLTELVRQVVDNAAKFSPDGSPITVRATTGGDGEAVIEVTDRGPGIPRERRSEVFGRFARWRPSGYEERPGNGLGLFISRGIAAEHQGVITIEDGPDGGTMLRVRLPLGGQTLRESTRG
jgi:signal transduction histidine kinase